MSAPITAMAVQEELHEEGAAAFEEERGRAPQEPSVSHSWPLLHFERQQCPLQMLDVQFEAESHREPALDGTNAPVAEQ